MDRRTLLLAAAASAAAPLVAAQPMRHVFTPPVMSGAPGEVTMTPWRAMPGVQVLVEGRGPFTFGIDTGFPGMLSVSDAVAQAAGLTPTGQAQIGDPSGRNPVTVNRYTVAALAIGGMTFADVEAHASGLPAPPSGPPLDGVIGMALFGPRTLVLDFKGRRVAVSGAGLPPADGASSFDFTPGRLIELKVAIGDVVLPAHLDTGQSRLPLIVPQVALAGLKTTGEPRKVGEAHTVSQTIIMYAQGIDAPVRVGSVALPITEVGYPTIVPIANLGAAALLQLVVSVDLRAGRVRLRA